MLIECTDLRFAYRKGSPVLDGLSHRFKEGAVTAITGPSGCGKSTLLYLLALMMKLSAGSIAWAGAPVSHLPDADRANLRAAHSGFVFQDALLDPALSVLDNVLEASWLARIPISTAKPQANEILQSLGVGSLATHRPGEISGGQAQRVALTRALITEPSVIFADEPTGNLDHETTDVVWSLLNHAADGGATVIVATHDSSRVSQQKHQLVLKSL